MGTDRTIRIGGHEFRAEELSALVMRALLADAESALGAPVTEAVVSVPAYFSDAQRKATRIAGELAGLKVERLVNEPTAAALAYGLQQREGGRFLVFDLGGDDFVQAMADACLRDLGLRRETLSGSALGGLLRRLELAKRELSVGESATVEFQSVDRTHQWTLDQSRFDTLCEPLVQRLRAPLERAMRDARLKPAQLDEVVLIGGASRMPLCAKLVSRMFGRLPMRHVNPDEAVAAGACVAAGMKARDEQLD